jgi:hypothetical protein
MRNFKITINRTYYCNFTLPAKDKEHALKAATKLNDGGSQFSLCPTDSYFDDSYDIEEIANETL